MLQSISRSLRLALVIKTMHLLLSGCGNAEVIAPLNFERAEEPVAVMLEDADEAKMVEATTGAEVSLAFEIVEDARAREVSMGSREASPADLESDEEAILEEREELDPLDRASAEYE